MEVGLTKIEEVSVLTIKGRIDASSASKLENTCNKLLDQKETKVLIDGTSIDFISSAGLRVLLKLAKEIKKYSGNLERAAVELALLWRGDKGVRQLDAMMIVADKNQLLMISGVGDVFEPEGGVCAIGSGGNYALAAGKALYENTKLSAREIAEKAMAIAGNICVYTNNHITVEEV